VVHGCGKWLSGCAEDAERGNIVAVDRGGKRRIRHLLFCNLTASFAADSLQVQQLERIDAR
jgi:hypothetical protein